MGKTEELYFDYGKGEFPPAKKYERVHFVAHCPFQYVDVAKVRRELLPKIWEIEQELGYKVYYVDTKLKGLQPFWTDIDFIFDLPCESPVATLTVILVLGVLTLVCVALGIAYIWWTVWHEESEIFVCDQCETEEGEYRRFQGRADYDAHLQLEHPEKWEYIKEQREDAYWWTKLIDILPRLILALFGLTLISYIPKPKREED